MRVLTMTFMLLGVVAFSATTAHCLADEPGQRRALIFAPGDYEALPDSGLHSRGAKQLRDQLLRSGFKADNIRLLTGDAASADDKASANNFRMQLRDTINSAGEDDSLLVAVLSYGFRSGTKDFIACAETTLEDLDQLHALRANEVPESLIAVQKIAEVMKTAATDSELLLVDGAIDSTSAAKLGVNKRDVEDRFGTGELELLSGQYVVLNRRNDERQGVTQFTASVCDGLTEFADGDGSGTVSREELVAHIQRYAETFDLLPRPIVKGNVVKDFELASAGSLEGDGAFTSILRDQMALTLMQSARHFLLIVQSPDDARAVLQRAIAYRPSKELKAEISSMLLTLLAAEGDIDKAWKEAEELNQPLLVKATGEFDIETGNQVLGTISPGELVLFDLRQGGWLHPEMRFEVTFENESVQFKKLETPNGWCSPSAVKVTDGEAKNPDSSQSLIKILRQLNSSRPSEQKVSQR